MAIAVALGATAHTDVAVAQQAEGLEEVVVTARKRSENLQDLGAAVSALSADQLNRRFDVDLQSFANAAPNVMIDDLQQGPGSPAAISIRGIGTTDVEKSFDPTAGVVVDGIFIGANSGAMLKAIDLQGMEILRGPQGTLFGRNSIAGVINVTRRRPSTEATAGEVRLGVGKYSDFSADGYLNMPVNDTFAWKVGGAKNKRNGWFNNRTLGKKVGELDYWAANLGLDWKPMDGVEVYYRYDKGEQTQDSNTVHNMAQPGQVWCFFYTECAQGVQTPQSGDRLTVLQNGDGSNSFFKSDMHNIQAKWEFTPDYQLDYIFGSFKTKEAVFQDWDGTSRTLYHTNRPANYYQRSHELRLTHGGDGALTYTVGLYKWDSGYRIDLQSFIGFGDFLFGLPSGTVLDVRQTVKQKTDSSAIFFEGDYKFTDALTLTVGGRYTKDKKESGVIDAGMPQLATLGSLDNPFKKDWSQFSPKVSLRYRINDDLMVFGLFSKGFRAGGFSGRPGTYEAASIAYDPETVNNFEAGWKAEFLDNRVRFNGSVYWMKYKNKQEEQSVPTSSGTGQQTIVLNAATATLKGIELELAAKLGAGFGLNASFGYLDAGYDSFRDPIDGADLTYLKLRRAPKTTFTVTPSYEWEGMGGEFWMQADAHFVSATELTFFNSPQSHNGSTAVIDASINYRRGKATWSLWGSNLTDEDNWTQAYDVGTSRTFAGLWTYAATRPPRTYGVRVQFGF